MGVVAALCGGCTVPGTFALWTSAKPDVRVPVPAGELSTDWKTLARELQDRLRQQPDDPVALTQLGYVLTAQGKFHAAEQMYRRSLSLAPNSPDTHLYLGQLLADRDADEALRHARRAAKLDPDLGAAHALCGQMLRRAGQNQAALAALEKAWNTQRPSVAAGVELAEWDLARGSVAAASDRLRLCLAYQPNHAAARRLYAELLSRQGKLTPAADQWQRLIDQGEPGAEAHFQLARLQHQLGRPEEALRSYHDGRRIAPRHPQAAALAHLLAQPAASSPHGDAEYPPLASSPVNRE